MEANEITMAEKIAEVFDIPFDDTSLIQKKYIEVSQFVDYNNHFELLTGIAGSAGNYAVTTFGYVEGMKTISAMWCLFGYLLKEKELRE